MAVAAGDRWVWFGLFLILLFSGLIAYVGDTIGRRIGRKRLSLLGMRPRNTAIFFTVITGMLIASLAVGAILLVSEGARQRILHFTETVTRLQAQATQQQQQRERAEALARAARAQKSQAERQLVVAGEALRTARQRFDVAEASR
ncbi:MAG: DUF3084 domain-containing protein, partial [Armatimonadetes bacterium]|nr:DUF3084 domain-containing protein [Armatimonadota bacterium]